MAETNKNKEIRLAREAESEKRIKCIVSRKYDNVTTSQGGKSRIFSSAVVMENGKRTLKWFKFQEDDEIELPVEIIEQLKGRKISRNSGSAFKMVPEFIIDIIKD